MTALEKQIDRLYTFALDRERDTVARVRALEALPRLLAEYQREIIAAERARRGWPTWTDLGVALGISRQAAQQRYGDRAGVGESS